jgi:phosphate transport system permease protein
MWQSSGATDDFEPKLSLIPLLFGTLKGAFYALLFALPVAILAAIYTALFAHPSVRNIIKPTVEIMAALPSVVIGFVAALWLAPFLEKMLAEVIFICILVPLVVVFMSLLWSVLPSKITGRWKDGSELIFILIGICLISYLAVTYGPLFEQPLFGSSFKQWIVDRLGVVYDQRNSIVVGFAMGFAVIPIIFTISEDALSSVPEHLKAGSLALGATRWQTATRVILPTASPGIFSAAMIGFGRAVGETMIVLMATGNTPIMDWSPFVGMRTLSANIAVELPEAPYLGTLYRVLFFSGLLLFLFTFVVNTVAELVRHRLRHRYSTI